MYSLNFIFTDYLFHARNEMTKVSKTQLTWCEAYWFHDESMVVAVERSDPTAQIVTCQRSFTRRIFASTGIKNHTTACVVARVWLTLTHKDTTAAHIWMDLNTETS